MMGTDAIVKKGYTVIVISAVILFEKNIYNIQVNNYR